MVYLLIDYICSLYVYSAGQPLLHSLVAVSFPPASGTLSTGHPVPAAVVVSVAVIAAAAFFSVAFSHNRHLLAAS